MATVIADATPVNVEGVTRESLFKALAQETGFLQTGVATSGNTDYLIDTTRLKTSQGSKAEWIGGWLRISQTSDNAAPEGEISPVHDFEPELGKVNVEPYLSAPIAATDKYELWKINPSIVKDTLDKCLTNDIYIPCWTVLSEIIDYDMEQTGTTHWTASGATVSKQSAAPRLSGSGKQYLRVVSTNAGDYARSDLLRAEPGRTYHVSAVARASAAGTTAKLVAYDETNGAVIKYATSPRLHPARINFQFTAPNTCYTVSIRLTNVEAGVTTEWDEVAFYDVAATDVALPWWVRTRGQVKGIFRYEPYGLGTDVWDATLRGERDSRFDIIKNYGGGSAYRVQARAGTLTSPLFILGNRNETAYADDNVDKKYVDSQLLLKCLKWRLYELHSQPLVTGLLDALNFKAVLGMAERDYKLYAQNEAEDVAEVITSQAPYGRFLDHRFTYGGS